MLRQVLSVPCRAAHSSLRQIPAARPQFYQMPSISSRIAQPSVTRWYSAEAESKPKEGEAPKEPEASDPVAELKKQLEAKDAEARDWKDKAMRTVADFRNLQERTTREVKSAKDYAIQKFAKDLVDSVDNLDRALAMVPEDKLKEQEKSEHVQDLVNLYEGLKLTENILMNTLKKHGLERFDPNGEPFNPNEHEATFMTPMADKEHNTVFHTQQKGFKLNGRVLRAAKVGVVKNK
ncbi:Mitochondrial matrix cochaperone [Coniochaeta pulveracea]|uniref:GrpE protein homolog n=1 Tax=Coniochaeta pulveracea TaxID=177199 RepID=A0A420YHF3_9PEZI|nr:Mitochondrial matrix cochaperone [Coniochaeta pulveracea]